MSNELAAKQVAAIDSLCFSLTKPEAKLEIQQSLPPGLDVEMFLRTAVNALRTHPEPEKLAAADQRSLLVACQFAARDGLILDGKEAALVVFKNKKKNITEVQYMPMVHGYVKRAMNSGQIAKVYAQVVRMKDKFSYVAAHDEEPDFEIDYKIAPSERGDPYLVFAVVHLKDGTVLEPAILHRERVMELANQGHKSYEYEPGPNPKPGKNWTSWWEKAAIKNVLKFAPKSAQLLSEQTAEQPTALDQGDYIEGEVTQEALPVEEMTMQQQNLDDILRSIENIKSAGDFEVLKKSAIEHFEEYPDDKDIIDTHIEAKVRNLQKSKPVKKQA